MLAGLVPGLTVDGSLRLHKAPGQKYLSEGHPAIFVASLITLLFCAIIVPATLVTYLQREMAGKKLHREPTKLFKIGVFYAPLNDKHLILYMSLSWVIRSIIAVSGVLTEFKVCS